MANLGSRLRDMTSRSSIRSVNLQFERVNRLRSRNMSPAANIDSSKLRRQDLGRIRVLPGRVVVRHGLGVVPVSVSVVGEGVNAYLAVGVEPTSTVVHIEADADGWARVSVQG